MYCPKILPAYMERIAIINKKTLYEISVTTWVQKLWFGDLTNIPFVITNFHRKKGSIHKVNKQK